MKKTLLVTAALLAACSKPVDPLPAATAKLEAVKTAMCACKDKACAEKVHADLAPATAGLSAAQVATLDATTAAIATCETAASSAIVAAIAQMTVFRDRTCACKDLACTTAVSDDMMKWSETMSKALGGDAAPAQAQLDQFTKLGTELGDCSTKLAATLTGPEDALGSGGLFARPDSVASSPKTAAMLVQMNQLTDEFCACTTVECGTKVNDTFSTWTAGLKTEDSPPSQAEMKAIGDVAKRYQACMTKLGI